MNLRVEQLVKDAKEFIDGGNPNVRTSSFTLTEEEYNEFKTSDFLQGYKVISEHLNLDNDNYRIVLAKGDFNWLIGGYIQDA